MTIDGQNLNDNLQNISRPKSSSGCTFGQACNYSVITPSVNPTFMSECDLVKTEDVSQKAVSPQVYQT